MSLTLNDLKNLFFNNEVRNSVLDPLTCIIRCAILAFKPHGTKISIQNNKINYHDPNFLQGTIRWTQGDKREDLHNIYNPILKSTQWYSKDNTDIFNIFRLAKKGLEKLKNSYDKSSIISHSLELYINILNLFLNGQNQCMKELFSIPESAGENKKKVYGILNKESNESNDSNYTKQSGSLINNDNKEDEDNKIYKTLKSLWNDTQISIVNNILQQVETDTSNSSEWLYSLDIILSSKEKNVSDLIRTTTTQLI
jgi:hypothetical protein